MEGSRLIKILVEITGLPEHLIGAELRDLIKKNNLKEETVTLDEVRLLLAEYLQDVLVSAKAELERHSF